MPLDVYQTVTDKVLAALESGTPPWRDPILTRYTAEAPQNLATGRHYRGCNVFLLAITAMVDGYSSNHWLTFRQANALGGSIRKGEKGSLVIFWKPKMVKDRETGEDKKIFILRYYTVFNAEQCDLPEDKRPAPVESPATRPIPFEPIACCEAVVDAYEGPDIVQNGSQAFYRPLTDQVHIPVMDAFTSADFYYATLFHELAHSTGHSSRLDRGLDTKLAAFGSADYSKEELVAEMTAAFLCGHTGIDPATLENQAAYLQGWIKALKGDKRLVVHAGGQAQRAADLILGLTPEPVNQEA